MEIALDSPNAKSCENQKGLLIIIFNGRKTEKVGLIICNDMIILITK